MEKFSIALLLIWCITTTIDADTVRCDFGSHTWKYLTTPFYYCKVQNLEIFTKNQISIDAAVGTHKDNNENDDVTEFWIKNAPNLVHFPKNLENVFPDLEGITISKSKLQSISQDDLKVFPRLKGVYFAHNQLKVITADTFKFNPKLELISLFDNIIFHIEPHTFDELKKLRVLQLHNNDKNCNLTEATTKIATDQNIENVNNQKCFSRVYVLEQRMEKLENQTEQSDMLISQMLIQIQVLTKKLDQQ
jgi:hypothetical protein